MATDPQSILVSDGRPPYAAVAVLAGAALALEVLLLRVFSILHWHHATHLAVGLALLGFALSGTLLVLGSRWRARLGTRVLPSCAVGFAVAVPAAVLCAQSLPFNALTLLWDPRQWILLGGVFLVFMVPFLLAGLGIGASLRLFPADIARLYGSDLIGAGAGCLAVLASLAGLPLQRAVWFCAALGLVAAALVPAAGRRAGMVRATCALLAAGLAMAPAHWLALQESEHKALPRMLQVPGTSIILRTSGAHAEITVVESVAVPFRVAPGLSLSAGAGPPDQLALFFDRDRMEVLDRLQPGGGPLPYLDAQTPAAAWALTTGRPASRVLVAGLHGPSILLALQRGAASVQVFEPDRVLLRLVRGQLAPRMYWPDAAGRLQYQAGDVRTHLLHSGAHYDIVVFPMAGEGSGSMSGAGAAGENFLLTRESFHSAWKRLAPGGVLAVTVRLRVPPRAGLRLVATVAEALEGAGVTEPEAHLAILRSWETVTVLVTRDPLTRAAHAALRTFAERWSFDLAWLPGLDREETNRYNRLAAPWLYDGARALLQGDREGLLSDYRFDIRPVTDDRPYFAQFLRPSLLPALWQQRDRGALGLVELAYPTLWISLLLATLLAAGLVLAPLRALPATGGGLLRARVAGYFLLTGFAFLFVELALLQRFTLYLGHPVPALALVLGVFLVTAGCGSLLASRVPARRWVLAAIVGGIALGVGAWLPGSEAIHALLAQFDPAARMAMLALLVAPAGLLMGMPFALGMARLRVLAPDWIPWAWGLNGAASVVAALAAALVLVHGGFPVLVMTALTGYLLLPALRP